MNAHLQTTYHNVVRQPIQTNCSKGTKYQFLSRHCENLLLSNQNSAVAQNIICFFLRFEIFFWKLLNFLIPKQKICSSTKSYRIMNHLYFFELIFVIVLPYVNFFSHIFFHFMGRRDFLGYYVTKTRA